MLALSCIVYGTPSGVPSDPPEDAPFPFWRLKNGPSPGHRGRSVTVDLPDLGRALISYHARPLRLAGADAGACFFDKDPHDEPAK